MEEWALRGLLITRAPAAVNLEGWWWLFSPSFQLPPHTHTCKRADGDCCWNDLALLPKDSGARVRPRLWEDWVLQSAKYPRLPIGCSKLESRTIGGWHYTPHLVNQEKFRILGAAIMETEHYLFSHAGKDPNILVLPQCCWGIVSKTPMDPNILECLVPCVLKWYHIVSPLQLQILYLLLVECIHVEAVNPEEWMYQYYLWRSGTFSV